MCPRLPVEVAGVRETVTVFDCNLRPVKVCYR